MKERITMNTNNASLQKNQQNYEFTNQALEVCLKLLNGYELHMEDKTPSNLSVLFVRKGNNFSTYQRQNLVKSNSRLMAFAKAQAPMSEVDKIKLAVSGDVQRFANTPEAVKLANSVIGNFGAHAHFRPRPLLPHHRRRRPLQALEGGAGSVRIQRPHQSGGESHPRF